MSIADSTLLTDATLELRHIIASGCTDPLSPSLDYDVETDTGSQGYSFGGKSFRGQMFTSSYTNALSGISFQIKGSGASDIVVDVRDTSASGTLLASGTYPSFSGAYFWADVNNWSSTVNMVSSNKYAFIFKALDNVDTGQYTLPTLTPSTTGSFLTSANSGTTWTFGDRNIFMKEYIGGTRSSSSSYVMTSYPKRPSQFPFIVVQDDNISDERLGAGNEASKVNLTFKVDIFAKKVGYDNTGRDRIWNNVYDTLRTNQLGTSPVSGTHLIGLHDFKLLNTWNMDEPGIEGVHRKIARVNYVYYTG